MLVHLLSNENKHLFYGSFGQVSIINVFKNKKNLHRIKSIKHVLIEIFFKNIKDVLNNYDCNARAAIIALIAAPAVSKLSVASQ